MALRNDPTRGAQSSSATPSEPRNTVAGDVTVVPASQPPKTAAAALALAQGVSLEAWSKANGGSKLELRKLDADRIEVSLDGAKKGDKKSFILDLKNPQAQRAFEDLANFRLTKADLMAGTPKKTGVLEVKAKGSLKQQTTKGEDGSTTKTRTATGRVDAKKGEDTQARATVTAQQQVTTGATKTDQRTLSGEVTAQTKGKRGETEHQVQANAKGSLSTSQTTADGEVTGSEQGQSHAYGAQVAVKDGTGPRQHSVSASHQAEGSSTEVRDGNGQVVSSRAGQSAQTSAAVSGQKTDGEATLKGAASYEQKSSSAQTTGTGGNTLKTEQSKRGSVEASIEDKKGPEQYSVSGKYQGSSASKSETNAKGETRTQATSTSQTNAAASGQTTNGETTLKGAGAFEEKNARTQTTGPEGSTLSVEQARSGSIEGSVADTTGPKQYSASGKYQESSTTKVDVDAKGQTTTKTTGSSQTNAAVSGQKTNGETTLQAGAQYEQKTASQQTTGPAGITGSQTQAATLAGTVGVSDKTGPNQYGVQVSATRTTTGSSEQAAGGKTTSSQSESTTLRAGGAVQRGDTKAGVDLVQQWKQAAGVDAKGVRTQTGTVSREIDLTSSFKGDRKVGFEKDAARQYSLTLPPGAATTSLPLDAGVARQLPEGAAFTLQATGKMAIHGEADGFKGGVSNERKLEIRVQRGAGDTVTAVVDFTGKHDTALGYDQKFGGDKGLAVTVGGSHAKHRIDTRVDSFSFDLARPEHQVAYDALLRGNMAPAQLLAPSADAKVDTTRTVETRGKIGVSFDKLGGSVELSRRELDPKDAAITGDAHRQAVTERALASGQNLRWIEKGGAYEIGAGHSGNVAFGPAGFSYGFEGKRALEWRSLGPQVDGEGGALAPAMTAEDADKLTTGSEFQVRGRANVSGRAGVLAGWQAAVPGVKVGAGVGFDVSKGKQVELNVQVKKLDANVVEVRLDELDQRKSGRELHAKLGAELNASELAQAGGSLIAAIAKKPQVIEKLAQAQKALSAEFKAGGSHVREDGTGLRFQLDLSNPEARAAYDKLVRGNPEAALDLAGRQQGAVKLEAGAVMSAEQRERHVSAQIAGKTIFSSEEVRRDLAVEVTKDVRTERLDHSIAQKKSESIWGRRREVGVDAVSVTTPEAPQGRRFFRLAYSEKDRYTSEGELEARRDLARALGAEPVTERIEKDKREGKDFAGFISFARNDYGKLKTEIEVFITDRGVAALREKDGVQALQAYAEVLKEKDERPELPRWAGDGPVADRARGLLDGYRHATDTETRDAYRSYYEREFGWKNFSRDAKEYARAVDFANAVDKASLDGNPATWNRAMADHAKKAGFNFFDALAAMNKLAGPDEVLVNRFKVTGKAVDLEMRSEGLLEQPKLSEGFQPADVQAARDRARS